MRRSSPYLSELSFSQLLLEGEQLPGELLRGHVLPRQQVHGHGGDGVGVAAGDALQVDDVGLGVVGDAVRRRRRAGGLGGGGAGRRRCAASGPAVR